MSSAATRAAADAAESAPGHAVRMLLTRAQTLAAAGRPDAARPLLAAVRRLGGDADETDALDAQLLLQTQRAADAVVALQAAIVRSPSCARLRLLRAEALLLTGAAEDAARDAAEAVIAEPANARAKATLGVTLADLGCYPEAIACLSEAVRNEPDHPGFRVALARAQEIAGDAAAAAATLAEGIARAPRHLPLYHAAIQLALALGQAEAAIAVANAGRQEGVVDARLFGLLGQAHANLGHHPLAADAYAEALKLAPEDAFFRHMVAAGGRLPIPPRASDAFVRLLFDSHAERFDTQLARLEYRVPAALRAALPTHAPMPEVGRLGPVLDLGCGTGAMAAAMRGLPIGPWHGIDLSPVMLRLARSKGLYATLTEAALPDCLAQDSGSYPIAIAADLLCYMGDLTPMFTAVRPRLAAGGLFLASVEALPAGAGWALGPAGRYVHAPDYVAAVAAETGFDVLAIAAEPLRREGASDVDGLILVLRKAAS